MIIYLDLDGTLINTNEVWIEKVNKYYGVNYTTEDITHYDFLQDQFGKECEFFRDPEFYKDVVPIELSQWFVNKLKNLYGEENVFIATTSVHDVGEAKNELVRYYFDIPRERILHTGRDKYVHTKNGILIDDHLNNIKDHIQKNYDLGILFDRHGKYGWNKPVDSVDELFPRCVNYIDILKLIERWIALNKNKDILLALSF